MNTLKTIVLATLIVFTGVCSAQNASPQTPSNKTSLDALLQEVMNLVEQEGEFNRAREQAFLRDRNKQRQLLQQARQERKREEQRSDTLKRQFESNEKQLADLETLLKEGMGNLGEMFGVVRTAAADARAQFENSIISAQFPGRTKFLKVIAERKELPNIDELRKLWLAIQREITEQGKVVTFTAPLLSDSGRPEKGRTITRIGVFNALSDGKYLKWNVGQGTGEGLLAVLKPQPDRRFLAMAEGLQNAAPGTVAPMAVDPTRGAILALVVQSPSLKQKFDQGEEVGQIIAIVGGIGLLIALWRGLALFFAGMKIKSQLKRDQASADNALGRVMAIYTDNPDADIETLELKLDEAILRETPAIEAWLSFIKVLYVVAPLMGLLGTVVGMIETFQMITLFGTGDPKLMADGISKALVTTVLGLVVAIPLTLIHSLLAAKAKSIIHILEEQSAGIIALMAEKREG